MIPEPRGESEQGCSALPPEPSEEALPDEMRDFYLSGPMTGYPDFNYPAFAAATAELRQNGHTVWNPAENFAGRTDLTYRDYICRDMVQVMFAHAVAVLPGWQRSKGARLEVHLAHVLGLPVVDVDSLAPVDASTLSAIDGGERPVTELPRNASEVDAWRKRTSEAEAALHRAIELLLAVEPRLGSWNFLYNDVRVFLQIMERDYASFGFRYPQSAPVIGGLAPEKSVGDRRDAPSSTRDQVTALTDDAREKIDRARLALDFMIVRSGRRSPFDEYALREHKESIESARVALASLLSGGSVASPLPEDTALSPVYADVKAERVRQDAQWGGPAHDDLHDDDDWRSYREDFERKAHHLTGAAYRAALVKIAALAVAQIESYDRKYSGLRESAPAQEPEQNGANQ